MYERKIYSFNMQKVDKTVKNEGNKIKIKNGKCFTLNK